MHHVGRQSQYGLPQLIIATLQSNRGLFPVFFSCFHMPKRTIPVLVILLQERPTRFLIHLQVFIGTDTIGTLSSAFRSRKTFNPLEWPSFFDFPRKFFFENVLSDVLSAADTIYHLPFLPALLSPTYIPAPMSIAPTSCSKLLPVPPYAITCIHIMTFVVIVEHCWWFMRSANDSGSLDTAALCSKFGCTPSHHLVLF